jgi:hypothetical protein
VVARGEKVQCIEKDCVNVDTALLVAGWYVIEMDPGGAEICDHGFPCV